GGGGRAGGGSRGWWVSSRAPAPAISPPPQFSRRAASCRAAWGSRAATVQGGMSTSAKLGLLPLPFTGEGWGGGERAQILSRAPFLTLQPKSDLSDFGQSIRGRTRVNPSSAASGGGNTPSLLRHSA